jgi:heat shock protein HtpX
MMQAVGLKTHIWNNNLRSAFLLAGFPVLLTGMVFAIELLMIGAGMLPSSGSMGGDVGYALRLLIGAMPLAIGVSLVWFAVAYFANTAIISLATGAHSISRTEAPQLYNLLENLCISRGLKTPKLQIIEDPAMNAFASGLNESQYTVTVTRGLLDALTPAELEAVLAHELTHVMNGDGRGGGIVFVLIALAVAAIGYLLAVVIRMSLSRSREFVADAGAVELTKNPDAMISALQKISGSAPLASPEAVQAMFIENVETGFSSLFATHPPIGKRIEALVQYAGGRVTELAAPVAAEAPVIEAGADHAVGPWDAPRQKGPWG